MRRRRFDHLLVELSLALDRAVPRWELWTALCEAGADPEHLSRRAAVAFCEEPLGSFLASHGLALPERRARRLRRRVARYDPSVPTPEEIFARW